MKKEYIKPIIIHIKTWNDDALCNNMVSASLCEIGNPESIETIAPEGGVGGEDGVGGPVIGDDGNIWND